MQIKGSKYTIFGTYHSVSHQIVSMQYQTSLTEHMNQLWHSMKPHSFLALFQTFVCVKSRHPQVPYQ
jgi:hypothetical protein